MEENITERNDYKVNHRIKYPEVRVISDDGENVGVISTQEALRIAHDKELDLVVITEKAEPPVARILDFNKFLYEENKKSTQIKAKSKRTEVKEIRLNAKIDDGAIKVKANRAQDFLKDGNKVKITVVLRGRERAYPEMATEKLRKLVAELEEYGKLEGEPKKVGNSVIASMIRK